MTRGPLRKISIITLPEAEDAIGDLLQELFLEPAVAYTDVETRRTEVSVYLPKAAPWSVLTRERLRNRLQYLQRCGLKIGPGKITSTSLRVEDWANSWKRHFRPIAVGSTLLIKPSWSRRQPRGGQAVVVLDPGLSFGTGQHPTTLFCLQQLAACRRPGQRQSLLDLGSGSGILAIAAAQLGYLPIDALDFDLDAVRIARDNAVRNRLANKIRFRHQDLGKLPLNSRHKYSVICANLIASLLVAERKRILRRLAPDGILIVAGILRRQFSEVRRAYETDGLKLQQSQTEQEWRSASFRWRS